MSSLLCCYMSVAGVTAGLGLAVTAQTIEFTTVDQTLTATDGETLGLGEGVVIDPTGAIVADGGVISTTSAATIDNAGLIAVHHGGTVSFIPNAAALANAGSILIDTGSFFRLSTELNNSGSLLVQDSTLILNGPPSPITGTGTVDVTNSLVVFNSNNYVGQASMVQPPSTTGDNRYAIGGSLDLTGEILTIADAPGQRWQLNTAAIVAGEIASADGYELGVYPFPTPSTSPTSILRNTVLNADARIAQEATLWLNGPGTAGSGDLIVDGGTLWLSEWQSNLYTGPVSSAVFDRIVPVSGEVVIQGHIDNTGRTIRLTPGVDWVVDHLRANGIVGGRVEADPGAQLVVRRGYGSLGLATFVGVELAAPTLIRNTNAVVRGGLTLADRATVTIGEPTNSFFDDGRLVFVGNQTLGGTGTVVFNTITNFPSHPTYPRINMIQAAADTSLDPNDPNYVGLTIGEGVTVRAAGAGYIGGRYFYQLPPERVPITNRGVIQALGDEVSIFASRFDHTGHLAGVGNDILVAADEAYLGGTLLFRSSRLVIDSPAAELAGSFESVGAQVVVPQGVLDVTGTINTSADFGPGLEVQGDLNLVGSARADLSFNRDYPTPQWAIQVQGQVTLGGELDIDWFNPPSTLGSQIYILEADAIIGTFDRISVNGLGGSNRTVVVTHGPNQIIGTLALLGDLDLNGSVDDADFGLFFAAFTGPGSGPSSNPNADLDGDGDVDDADFGLSFSAFTGPGGGANVPEPASLGCLAFAGHFVMRRRRA